MYRAAPLLASGSGPGRLRLDSGARQHGPRFRPWRLALCLAAGTAA
jgi:hypothetical protein